MFQEMWGKLISMIPASTRTGAPVTVCTVEAQGKWNSETKERDKVIKKICYYSSNGQNEACLKRDFLVGQTVALIVKNTADENLKIGIDLPTSHGFLSVPAELKPASAEAIGTFNDLLAQARKYKRLPADYEANAGDVKSLADLSSAISSTTDPILTQLRKAVSDLYWCEKWSYIGPIGGVYGLKNTPHIKRIEVCPYHKVNEVAAWSSLTFWDEESSRNLETCNFKPGDILYFNGMIKRRPYHNKEQFSAQKFHEVQRKKD